MVTSVTRIKSKTCDSHLEITVLTGREYLVNRLQYLLVRITSETLNKAKRKQFNLNHSGDINKMHVPQKLAH